MTSEACLQHSEINNQSSIWLVRRVFLIQKFVHREGTWWRNWAQVAKCTDLPEEGACCVWASELYTEYRRVWVGGVNLFPVLVWQPSCNSDMNTCGSEWQQHSHGPCITMAKTACSQWKVTLLPTLQGWCCRDPHPVQNNFEVLTLMFVLICLSGSSLYKHKQTCQQTQQ